MSEELGLLPPEQGQWDRALAVIRGGMQAIPLAGGLIAEVFDAAVGTPLQRRQQAWMEEIARRLLELEASGQIRIADLGDDETFVSTILQANQAAMRTHHAEKLEALRNAVLNSAVHTQADDLKQQLFIRWVDDFSPLHLLLLKLLSNPTAWPGCDDLRCRPVRSTEEIVSHAIPQISQGALLGQLLTALQGNELIFDSEMPVTRTGNAWRKRTSALGDDFLEFISTPVEKPQTI
jgi:hypothetical protein